MAITAQSYDKAFINDCDNHLETFSLIWLDANVNVQKNRDALEKLRATINHIKKFHDVEECKNYIKQTSEDDRLVLIVSGQLSRQIAPSIHHLRQVSAIYINSKDTEIDEKWACEFTKLKGVNVELGELVSQINEDHRSRWEMEESLSIKMFTASSEAGKSTTGINGEFVFSQLLIDCLLRLKSNEMDTNELISCCEKEYEGNQVELDRLRKFQKDYLSDKALWWYTCESFFYKTLNAALRKQNIHMLFLYRRYITDIHRQLQHHQSKYPTRVYRSQLMSIDELDYLQKCIGQFVSVNSFLSTTNQRQIADFYMGDRTQQFNLERVLFEIVADPKVVTTKPFADISTHSHFADESEVLFMLGSIFRLNSINCNDHHVWIISMSLCGDDEHSLQQVLGAMKKQNCRGKANLCTLGKVLWKMGKLDLAKQYYIRCVNEVSDNDPLLLTAYEDLADIASQQGFYEESVEWRQKLADAKRRQKRCGKRSWCSPLHVLGYVILLAIVVGLLINIINLLRIYINSPAPPTSGTSAQTSNTKWKQEGITIAGGHGKGNQSDQLDSPLGIFIDNDETIYIANWGNDRIVEWKWGATSGQIVAGENGRGSQTDQLNRPTDVIIDEENNSLIISDRGNRRVMRWSRENNTKHGETIIEDIDSFGLTMDKNGSLYISDCKKHEVRRWKRGDQHGTVVAGGNGEGNLTSQLNTPTYIFVDEDYSLYVSDTHNYRTMKWLKDAKEGIVVAGGYGQGNSLKQLSLPFGVIVDQLGQIYVADGGNHRVMRWSEGAKEGTIVVGGFERGKKPNQFDDLRGLSFDRQGNLYVADGWNHRIQKFEID